MNAWLAPQEYWIRNSVGTAQRENHFSKALQTAKIQIYSWESRKLGKGRSFSLLYISPKVALFILHPSFSSWHSECLLGKSVTHQRGSLISGFSELSVGEGSEAALGPVGKQIRSYQWVKSTQWHWPRAQERRGGTWPISGVWLSLL